MVSDLDDEEAWERIRQRADIPTDGTTVISIDTDDCAAYRLLERIARKVVEPMSEESDPNKTLGECRSELVDLLHEAVTFVMVRKHRDAGVKE